MSALIFIALTTPMTDLFIVMRRCRVPEAVLDLTMMIYRTIFMIMHLLVQTYQAQVMRLGYSSFRESIESFCHPVRFSIYRQLGCRGRPGPGHGRTLLFRKVCRSRGNRPGELVIPWRQWDYFSWYRQ